MFESLEEGIVLIKKNQITFSNTIFDQILNKNEDSTINELVLDLKVFKIFRKGDFDNSSHHNTNSLDKKAPGS